MRRWMMGATVMLGLALPTTGRAQTLGDTAAAMGTHSTLSGTSAGNPAATLGTVKSHVAAASAAQGGGAAAGQGWETSGDRAGSGWGKATDQRASAGWAKAGDQHAGADRERGEGEQEDAVDGQDSGRQHHQEGEDGQGDVIAFTAQREHTYDDAEQGEVNRSG